MQFRPPLSLALSHKGEREFIILPSLYGWGWGRVQCRSFIHSWVTRRNEVTMKQLNPKIQQLAHRLVLTIVAAFLAGCATSADVYKEPTMDFGSIRTVAVLPFANLTRDNQAAERVRDVFSNMLMATGTIYVVPPGEVLRGLARAGVTNSVAPSPEDIIKLGGLIKVDAVVTGVIREYGEVRSGSSGANVISMGLQFIETQTGKVVWTAASTQGGIGMTERLLGGGGEPMNKITEKAVDELIDKLFR